MTERKIVSFGATGWLKTIAWLQILYTLVGAVGSTGCLFLLGYARYALSSRSRGSEYYWEIIICTIGLNLSVVSAVFGVMLLKGAKQNSVTYIIYWAKYGSVFVVLYINMLLLGFLTCSGAIITITCLVLLPLVWTVFGIWIVWVVVQAASTPNGHGDKEISQELLLPPNYTSGRFSHNSNNFSQHV